MQEGSLMETKKVLGAGSFVPITLYPKLGEIVTVSGVYPVTASALRRDANKFSIRISELEIAYIVDTARKKDIVFLSFHEYPNSPLIANKTYRDEYNFIEIQTIDEVNVNEIMKEIEEPCLV